MEKKRNIAPESSHIVEQPLKQQKQEAEQSFDVASSFLRRLSENIKAERAAFYGDTSTFPFLMKRLELGAPHTPFSLLSIPAITEQDGGTSGHTAKACNYERYESCFAIAGADYCVIAADFTHISKLSEKCVMASFGFQADVKALQEALSAENLKYECEHNKPMSCPEMHRLLFGFEKRHPNLDFIVLGGLDSKGKGRIFQICGPGAATNNSEVGHPGSRPIVPPILKYKLPAKDVLARLSETEAVDLAKHVFKSVTNTGDKLEIFVLNANGVCRDHVDLRKEREASVFGNWYSPAFRPASDGPSFLRLYSKNMKAKQAAFGDTSTISFVMRRLEVGEPHTPFLLISIPAITEQDGGTSEHTAKSYNYERYESCFAIAGADYCVIAEDFTHISELSEKCVMASFGFQADVKALQEALSAENLKYECEHNKPMSCPEMHRLLFGFEKRHPNLDFIVLGGLDSKGKGCVFQICGPGAATINSEVGHPGSRPIVPPILKYKLPAKDVLARLSVTEAIDLAKHVFKSATNTGDKLEIFVLNANGRCHNHVDLRKLKEASVVSGWYSPAFSPASDGPSFLRWYSKNMEAEQAASFPFVMKRLEVGEPHIPFSLISIPVITEQDGGTSGHTAKSYNYERYESCFALAGADYCVIVADFTRNISKLSEKSVMASFGFQADVKALQEALSAVNLKYECEHNKPMSCSRMHMQLFGVEKYHPNLDFIVLGGLDVKGKGCVFQICGPGAAAINSVVGHPAPILKYKLPAKDVLARLSETEAVDLAIHVFKSATNTGDKLEIFVLNTSGLCRHHVDLRKDKEK